MAPPRLVFGLTGILVVAALSGCGTGSLDLAGYPDATRERLYHEGRLGGEAGYAAFDLRDAWRAVRE